MDCGLLKRKFQKLYEENSKIHKFSENVFAVKWYFGNKELLFNRSLENHFYLSLNRYRRLNTLKPNNCSKRRILINQRAAMYTEQSM